jgi:hypothetical protein
MQMTFVSGFPLILLVFALVFACIEAWKGCASIKPSSFGWLAFAILIAVEIFYHGQGVFK